MIGVATSLVAVCLCYCGVALFKAASARMEPLRGDRLPHLLGQLLTSRLWAAGLLLLVAGVELQLVGFARLPAALVVPLSGTAGVLLLGFTAGCFGERLGGRDWLGIALFALGALLVAASLADGSRGPGRPPPPSVLLAVAVPSLVLPALWSVLGHLRPDGRHRRTSAGVSYGVACGVLVGAAEIGVKGLAITFYAGAGAADVLAGPHFYIAVVGMALALVQGMIALQRARMAVCMTVATIVALIYLVVAGTFLFGGDWPSDPLWGVLRVAGVGVAVAAVFAFPREAPPEHPSHRARV
ncbi:hypothetical protein [Actinomadura rubrisoli]|uniref:Magnesium transporter NIPA n=1 Tax=Actinomadura rubrisoli TaxID=2530368 RepID=A0A4V2YZ80_9ACTN|nr:hypothetical protein [Actinomadura rubrisoli]TDD96057.1 hypothetical protein E1298_03690 [Actinomadura rubrisoli]